ncbi:endogenous retrovirus group K member 5 Gag polyprotein-like protein, partial [Leptotrombidium deliense]
DYERDVGPLPHGTLAVWKLVQSCLITPSPKFEGIVAQGTQALLEAKSHSAAASELGSGSKTDSEEEVSELGAMEQKKKKLGIEEVEGAMAQLQIKHKNEEVNKWPPPEWPPPCVPSETFPTVPPNDRPPPYASSGANRQQMWRAISQFKPQPAAFPVYVDQHGARYHQPLDWSLVKQLKEAVLSYGPQASFTVGLLESLGQSSMAPEDWMQLCKAILSGGQYLTWKAAWQEYSQETARRNQQAGNAA